MKKGFTLIELLVVITLIGILAIAVLSALNPIEQINKARDARRRADASQLLKAIDRYFASNEKFPWNNYESHILSVGVAFMGSTEMVGVGVCNDGQTTNAYVQGWGTGGCADLSITPGYLISTQELKRQFGKRDYFKTSVVTADKLYIYKAAGDPSTSICFIPSSKATRDTAGVEFTTLKNLSISGDPPAPTDIAECSTAPVGDQWADPETACFVCIPEE